MKGTRETGGSNIGAAGTGTAREAGEGEHANNGSHRQIYADPLGQSIVILHFYGKLSVVVKLEVKLSCPIVNL